MTLRSLRLELPLLISALLVAVVGAVSWAAYGAVVRALEASAHNHLGTAAHEIARNLDQAGARLRTDAQRLAGNPSVIRLLSTPDAESRVSARRSLEELRASRPQSSALTVWTRDGEAILTVGDSLIGRAPHITGPAASGRASGGSVIGPSRSWLVAKGDTVLLSTLTIVTASAGDTLGFVAERRLVTGGTQVEFIGGLIGDEARFAVGNADGVGWTDLQRAVEGPPEEVRLASDARYASSDGREWLASAAVVPSTGWRIWVEIPRHIILQPAREVLLRILGIALVIISTGVFGAWLLSRRITAPLTDVTHAAEGIAAGDYARRVSVHGNDEIGRLATSFNSMATRVEEATASLAAQAAELETANEELSQAVVDTELAQQEAEQSATELRELLRAVTDIVLVLDRDGHLVKVPETRSDALLKPAAELLGRRVHEFLPAPAADAVLATIRKALDERRPVELEYEVEFKDKGVRWFAGAASPIPGEQVFWVARDVTERHRLEEQLRQAQKMEAIGQLAGGIAHDFNNMLTAIRSFSELLLADMPAASPHSADVREIQAAADRAATLTRQLLAFSRRQLLQPVPIDLNGVVGGLHEMLQRLLGEDVDLVCRLDSSLHPAVADPGQIEQIVMNLAVNSRDAMPDGGRLTIETANIVLDEEYAARAGELEPGPYVVLSVSDTGDGMDAATQAHIFEPFFTTKAPGQGTGLGLSTVYGIVKQSGGHVTVYSELGRGTTFRVYLPRAAGQEKPAATPRKPMPDMPRGEETVLLVEDDPAVRLVAARILTRQGYRVLEAPTPTAAEALVAAHPGAIDLVMTDLVLPGMSGRELGELLTTVEPRLRVLYMSGYTDDAVIRRGLLEPGMPFLSKPFTVDELARVVRNTLDLQPS